MADRLERFRWPLTFLLLALILSGSLVWYWRWPPDTPIIIATPTLSGPPEPTSISIKVYVSGAVLNPGVYTFQEGDRVEDAIRAAGGPADDADLDKINQAARLHDEEHIVVPRVGEAVTTPVASEPRKININVASEAELDTLPGIGPITAKRIADYRREHGPFQRIEDLEQAKLVNSSTFEKIKDLVEVR